MSSGRRRSPVGAVLVSGASMLPALRTGDACLVRYRGRVRPGDVVVAQLPGRPLGVKRTVSRTPGGWWLASDNPAAGTDSATFGRVPPADVLGRVLLRYWPWPAWCGRGGSWPAWSRSRR